MTTIYIATHNAHKKEEIKSFFENIPSFSEKYVIKGLDDLDFTGDIPETADTLEGNALQKAMFIHRKYGVDCLADDTGLEVPALGNRPGVYSARYANMPEDFEQTGKPDPQSLRLPDPTFDRNIDRLLLKLQGKDPQARFRTVICLILHGRTYYFEGEVTGRILPQRQGSRGFGYDPVFRPDGFAESFAELDLKAKNAISHRGRALASLARFFNEEKDGSDTAR